MVNIQRVQVASAGYLGSPGVTTFYCLNASAGVAHIAAFLHAVQAYFPTEVHWTYPTSGDTINPINGELAGGWTSGGATADAGTAAESYAGPVGAIVNWETGTILDGHRLRGKTFLVPLASGVWDVDGRLNFSVSSAISAAAAGLVSDMADNLVVWHRPKKDKITHAITRDGGYSVVTAGHCPPKAAVLRSRRD